MLYQPGECLQGRGAGVLSTTLEFENKNRSSQGNLGHHPRIFSIKKSYFHSFQELGLPKRGLAKKERECSSADAVHAAKCSTGKHV